MPEVCVTGASGFVGRHLLDRLARESDISTVVLSRRDVDRNDVRAVRGDLLDPPSLQTFVTRGSTVVHLAYSNAPGFDNVLAAENLARVVLQRGAARFVHVSTAVVVGRCRDERVDESTVCAPSNRYELEKLDIEQRLTKILDGRLDLRILRPTAVFGSGGRNLVSLAMFLLHSSRLAAAARMTLMGKRRMNLVAVENVAEAIHHMIRMNGGESGRFIVTDDHASGNHYTNVAQRLMEGMAMSPVNPAIDVSFVLGPLLRVSGRALSNPATSFSAARLRSTGYDPVVDFDESVRRFGVWIRQEQR